MDFESMQDIADLALLGVLGYAAYEANKEQQLQLEGISKKWVRELNLARDVEGFYVLNYEKMQAKDPQHFFKITRMNPRTFQLLRTLIEPSLEKTSWREPISPSCRLFLTLLYLSQGVPRQVLAWIFRLGYSTVGYIIYETCDAIWNVLMPLYMEPLSEENWKQNAIDFETIWNLPNCTAAIDGKHINIRCPPNAGSEYFNYKGHHSIVLLAACDANYIFVAVDIGAYGSQSDGGILPESAFGKNLISGNLNLPPPSCLPNSNIRINYYLVGDAAFPLKPYLMRPYPGRRLSPKKINYNKRLSRARRVIENAFGILVARWRILEKTLNMLPKNAEKIVKATTILHNFLKLNEKAYSPRNYVDVCDENDVVIQRGQWRNEIVPLNSARIGSNNSAREAYAIRDAMKEYLFQNRI